MSKLADSKLDLCRYCIRKGTAGDFRVFTCKRNISVLFNYPCTVKMQYACRLANLDNCEKSEVGED